MSDAEEEQYEATSFAHRGEDREKGERRGSHHGSSRKHNKERRRREEEEEEEEEEGDEEEEDDEDEGDDDDDDDEDGEGVSRGSKRQKVSSSTYTSGTLAILRSSPAPPQTRRR